MIRAVVMRRLAEGALWLIAIVAVSAPPTARACGPDPCESYAWPGLADSARVFPIRDDDGPGRRLEALMRVYLGGDVTRKLWSASHEASWQSFQADSFAARLRDFCATHRVAMPTLAEHPTRYLNYFDGVCGSNDYAAAARFLDAIAAEPALLTRLDTLIGWRLRLVGWCASEAASADSLIGEMQRVSKGDAVLAEAATYLEGAALFYTGRAAAARTVFERATQARNPWIAETSRYMIARSLLIAAQAGWDGWGDRSAIDVATLTASRTAFATYSARFPNGRYASSARGIERRILLLSGGAAELARLEVSGFHALLADGSSDPGAGFVLGEATAYFPAAELSAADYPWSEPLLAVANLPRARWVMSDLDGAMKALAEARSAYSRYPGLYVFTRSSLELAAGRPTALGEELPANAPPLLRLSLHLLRARALAGMGRNAAAREALRQVAIGVPAVAQDARFVADVARLHRADGDWAGVFAPGSPFRDSLQAFELFDALLTSRALGELPASGTVGGARALTSLRLLRHLRSRQYLEFLELWERAGKPAPFGEAETAARRLVANPNDAAGLFNAGYFLQLRDHWPGVCCVCYQLSSDSPLAESERWGAPPIDYYVQALARLATQPPSDLEAKVLHYAILTHKPGTFGYAGLRTYDERIPQATRRAWFQRLKTRYPNSSWARKTPYFY
ncbi:MAG: hypothetical protein HOP12_00525 [Candidatus Eisenbacteria bacterium]|uniref:DUF4034 domain-containing protein n=1 Tax=Eiseniibacteriota bacterium TaxID=2212470 RepID=A0A849SE26_UNCEI|nr:hypothetical protein [Candidatus Eisenbacteria bacterium]